MNRRDVLISRLLAKSTYILLPTAKLTLHLTDKEYITDKDRQEIELQSQRLTLQEQRNHIEILDTALMNAQNNIITLEAEVTVTKNLLTFLNVKIVNCHCFSCEKGLVLKRKPCSSRKLCPTCS